MTKEMCDHMNKMSKIKDTLLCFVESETSKSLSEIHTKELGEVIDMVKDLSEAEKYCTEACYFESVANAMEEYGEDDSMGYNNRRYASGRYAPKGSGSYGYTESKSYPMNEGSYGYSNDGRNMRTDGRMGYVPNQEGWIDRGRRYYHDGEAEGSMEHTMDTIKQMWANADPELRKRMKTDMSNLMAEMNR